jgi:nitrite reductase (NADH) small subunit
MSWRALGSPDTEFSGDRSQEQKNAMPAFINSEHLARLTPGKGVVVTTGDSTVALFNVDGAIHAIEGWCMRCGACLADASIEGETISCGGCDWRYNVVTGGVIGVPGLRLRTFDANTLGIHIIGTNR